MQRSVQRREGMLAALILISASLLVWSWPERLPGLHVDEAWSFFRAREIVDGLRPIDGMNYYTGALHHYLLAASVELFGLHVWVLHLLSGGANLAMLAGYMLLVRRLHPERDTWLWVGALSMSSATFVIYSRLGIELCALTPLLLVSGALLVQRSATAGRAAAWALAFGGGVLLGLAVYNHMAAAAVVAGVVLGYLVATAPRCLIELRNYAAALGLLAGLSPRLWQLEHVPARQNGPLTRLLENLTPELYDDAAYLPQLLRGMLDGDLIYQRVTGVPRLFVVPFFSVAFGLLLLLRLRFLRRSALPGQRDLGWLVAIVASTLAMVVISDHLALRYYEVPALAMPYLLARLASFPPAVNDTSVNDSLVPRWARQLGRASLLVVIGLQGLYVGINYFYAHLSTGGRVHTFALGKHVMEASNGFVRTDRLYRRLVEMNVPYVVADNIIRWPLEFYDIPADHFRSSAQPYNRRWRVPKDGPTALVYYNGPTPMGGLKLDDRRGRDSVRYNGQVFTIEPEIDPNFLVFMHRPAPR